MSPGFPVLPEDRATSARSAAPETAHGLSGLVLWVILLLTLELTVTWTGSVRLPPPPPEATRRLPGEQVLPAGSWPPSVRQAPAPPRPRSQKQLPRSQSRKPWCPLSPRPRLLARRGPACPQSQLTRLAPKAAPAGVQVAHSTSTDAAAWPPRQRGRQGASGARTCTHARTRRGQTGPALRRGRLCLQSLFLVHKE